MSSAADKLLLGLVRIHVLAAAESSPIWGNKILAELRQHDQSLSPGTLYPLLRGLVRDGLLTTTTPIKGRSRQLFELTAEGRKTLASARARMEHLLNPETASGIPTKEEPSLRDEAPPVHLL